MDFHVAFSRALGLDRPVFMGCSIGGDVALDLAFAHPDKFRAAVAFGSAELTPGFDTRLVGSSEGGPSRQVRRPVWGDVAVRPGKVPAGSGLGARQELSPVFRGDSYYYSVEHDLTGKLDQIDTSRVAVYVLAGEYDFAATPEMGRETASKIRGAKYKEMKRMGHFCMAEDYKGFRQYLMPVLHEIAQNIG